MPRGCGCAGNSCGCLVQGSGGVTVTGTGNASEPYIVSLTQSGLLELGPYTAPGWQVVLTSIADSDAIIRLEYEANGFLMFSENAPIGTRVEVHLQPSFGATLEFMGNVWLADGVVDPIPAPPSGNIWLSAVKMDALNWFVRVSPVAFF